MRLRWVGAALVLGGVGTGGQAQEQITPQEFLDRATGNTLTFTHDGSGRVVGVEQFLSPDLSVWADVGGRCAYGDIELRGELICFLYRDNPDPNNCWMPFDKDGEMMVISSDSLEIQRITGISEQRVDCVGAPLS
jgi:hypothetical protein